MNTKRNSAAGVRVNRPQRDQIEWRPLALEALVADEHRVRSVWAYVDALDLTPLYEQIRAVEGSAGRNAVDPRILLALWMFATIEGVSSARHLARLCERDLPYLWLCGGVGVNHHLLSDFRALQADFLDQLLTDTISTLLHQNIVTLETVAQDGMRVRASAGSSSFHRRQTLEACRDAAADQVRRLREEQQTSSDATSEKRRDAARQRAAREREQRVEQALQELAELREQKERKRRGSGAEARCSTTDPEARKMKMPDGGFRPAYNVQFASDGAARIITAVEVSANGSDGGQMQPLHANLRRRYGVAPGEYLVDGGFVTKEDVTALQQQGSCVLAPIPRAAEMRQRGTDPHLRQPGDTDEFFAFRQRMQTDAAKAKYRQRSSIAEYPNAVCRNQGLSQFRVRGLQKVRAVALWHAITFNFLRMLNLNCLPT